MRANRIAAAPSPILLLALLAGLSSAPALAQSDQSDQSDETDRVVMTNGDVLTGEIKSLDRGMSQRIDQMNQMLAQQQQQRAPNAQLKLPGAKPTPVQRISGNV